MVHSLLSHGANIYAVTNLVISIPVLAFLTASAMTLHKDIAVLAFSLIIAAFSKVCYILDCLHASFQSCAARPQHVRVCYPFIDPMELQDDNTMRIQLATCIAYSSRAFLVADDKAVGCLSCTLFSVLQGQTALHAGASSGRSEVVHLLLANGARANAVDNSARLAFVIVTPYLSVLHRMDMACR